MVANDETVSPFLNWRYVEHGMIPSLLGTIAIDWALTSYSHFSL